MTHDPGGKIKTALPPGMAGGAEFSTCGRYRRALWRRWDDLLAHQGGYVLFIGMNPSMADADHNDPTITREIGFARRWGFRHLVKCNIGDYRATHPRDLPSDPAEACTQENLAAIEEKAKGAQRIVMAHGAPPAPLRLAAQQVFSMLSVSLERPVFCLGFTSGMWPRHPLYLPNAALLHRYRGTEQ